MKAALIARTVNRTVGAIQSRKSMLKAEGEMTRNRSLLLGIGIGLFGALAVLTLRYVCAVLAG